MPDMQPGLFQRYLDGNCSLQEKRAVDLWLQSCTKKELDDLLSERWNSTGTTMPEEQANALWQILYAKINPGQQPGNVIRPGFFQRYRKLIVAAASVLLVAIALWILLPGKQNLSAKTFAKQQPVTPAKTADNRVTISNDSPRPLQFNLEDGSTVVLYNHSSLNYLKGFSSSSRDLYLEGDALFTVAKDKHRPFTVYSGDISTTALGTIFRVNTGAGEKYISVKLFRGKVVVAPHSLTIEKWKEAMVLQPGQELKYDRSTMTAVIAPQKEEQNTKPQNQPITHLQDTKSNHGDITFTNVPLAEVFKKLTRRFNTKIAYRQAEIADIYFTGTISGSDSLAVILKIITQMNGLETSQQPAGFLVQKSLH